MSEMADQLRAHFNIGTDFISDQALEALLEDGLEYAIVTIMDMLAFQPSLEEINRDE